MYEHSTLHTDQMLQAVLKFAGIHTDGETFDPGP